MYRLTFIALVALAPGHAPAEEAARRDPADPRSPVPSTEYRSAFAGYQRFGEEKLAPWRDSNEAVKAPPPRGEAKPDAKGDSGAHGAHR